jgi:ATP-dependent DNA helicase RecG
MGSIMAKESQNIEWKESWRDEYLKWICGFANAQGGKIYIGKNDNGVVTGIPNAKKLLEDIPNKISNFLGIIADVNLYTEDGKEYLEIIVTPNSYPVSYRGEYHYRSGSTKQQLTGQALNQFLLKKTGITWDSVPVDNVEIRDMRNDSFDIFREQAVRSGRMSKQDVKMSNEELLDSLKLVENGKFTRAAVLLFHHDPEKWIPGAYIKIGYFESDSDLRYQDEVKGSLVSQADKVVDLLFTKYLKADISYEGVTRVETYPYPKEALREAIYNAIVHKNYATLIPIQISVYADRIYIGNDCVFPEDWTIDDLLGKHRSRAYNPLIANTFFRAGYIEAWGRGIEKIKESCMENGNDMAEYQIRPSEVMVVFYALHDATENTQDATQVTNQATNQANQATNQANHIQEKLLELISENGKMSQKELAKQSGEKISTVKYYMYRMRQQGIIERVGTSQKGHWEVRRNINGQK